MPKFTKSILPEGEYLITLSNGKQTLKRFTKDFLSTVVDNTNKMIKEGGLRIPAPFKHVEEAIPVEENVATDSFQNAGYWDSFELKEKDGVATLCGVIDAPGSVDNLDTPAGKLQNTVKEVSACIKEAWRDGKDRLWGPCILHGAPVLHPVVPGQEGFSLVDEAFALSASGMLSEPSSDSIADLSKAFSETVGIYLPPGTPPEDIVKVLMVSLNQYKLAKSVDEDEAAIVDTQSIFMSLPQGKKMPFTTKQAEELVGLGLLDPNTKEPIKIEDLKEHVSDEPSPERQYALALTQQFIDQRKNGLKDRINKLVETGRCNKEYAEATLYPEVDKYQLSLGDGAQFQKNNIDMLVESLEQLEPKVEPSTQPDYRLSQHDLPPGATSHNGDPGEGDKMTDEQMEAMTKEMLMEMNG